MTCLPISSRKVGQMDLVGADIGILFLFFFFVRSACTKKKKSRYMYIANV